MCTPKQDKMLHLTAYTTHTHLSDGHFQKVKSAQSFPVKNNTINQWSDISLLLCFIFYVHMSQFLCVLEFEPIISPQNLIAYRVACYENRGLLYPNTATNLCHSLRPAQLFKNTHLEMYNRAMKHE